MWTRFVAVLLGLAMTSAGALTIASAQGETTAGAPTDLEPQLVVFTVPGYSGVVDRTAGARVPLLTNEAFGVAIGSGVPEGCGHTLQVSVSGDAHISEAAAAVWTLQARRVSFEGDTAVADLRWTRAVRDSRLKPAESTTVEQRITLTQGGRGILDVVTGPPDDDSVCPSFAVGVGLELVSPGDLREAAGLEYDFWLVRGGATERPPRARAVARQGGSTTYAFQPIRLPEAGAGSAASDASASMNWSGSVTGRARTDGTIDLSIDAFVAVMDAERSRATGSSSLRKQLRVGDGETVDIEFPAESWSGLAPSHAWERTALRVTARRVW
jgi:hypothetical protein